MLQRFFIAALLLTLAAPAQSRAPQAAAEEKPDLPLAHLLLEAHARREDPGAVGMLRAYERWRKSEVALMGGAIEAFDRLLAHGSGPLARLAQRGLGVVGRSAELRRFFIYRALGLRGELPQAAR